MTAYTRDLLAKPLDRTMLTQSEEMAVALAANAGVQAVAMEAW